MASTLPPSSPPARPRPQRTGREAAYRLRVLLGLTISLGTVTVAFRVPWGAGTPLVGWGAPRVESFEVTFLDTEPEDNKPAETELQTPLVSRYRIEPAANEPTTRAEEEEPPARALTPPATPEEPSAPRSELEKLAPILEFADEAPELIGGLGSLYLHIRYPQAAVERGIEGRLILKFVVEPDGRTSEIVVEKALHPLCDSAAVRALRAVAFVPGRQHGEAARVRMRLPVRFRLVSPGAPPSRTRRRRRPGKSDSVR